MKALFPSNPFTRDPLKSPTRWKRHKVTTAMKMIVGSGGSCVYYAEMCDKVRQV